MQSRSVPTNACQTIVAPSLVKNGLAFGKSISDEYPLVSYISLSFNDPSEFVTHPSPRYWLLWPGVFIMLVYSFADVVISLAPGAWGMSLFDRLFLHFTLLIVFAPCNHVAMRKEGINFQSWFRTSSISEEDEDQVWIRLFLLSITLLHPLISMLPRPPLRTVFHSVGGRSAFS